VFRASFSDAEPLGPQIDALVRKAHMIRSLGQDSELDDKLVAFAIISSLPSSLSLIRAILFCTTKLSDISTVYVTRFILDNEERRECTSASANSAKRERGERKTSQPRNIDYKAERESGRPRTLVTTVVFGVFHLIASWWAVGPSDR
jgi:hypothetical protein